MGARVITCVVLDCDGCGTRYGEHENGPTFHYGDVVEAYRAARGDHWWAEGHHVVCDRCLRVAACALLGHQWSEWRPVTTTTYTGRHRRCRHCPQDHYDPPLASGEAAA